MDQTALVETDIQIGEEATRALDESKALPVRACLWQYVPEAAEWRLLVASPLVDEKGPREAYTRIQQALQEAKLTSKLPLRRISAVSPTHDLIKLLRGVIKTGRKEIAHIWFSNNTINNTFIEGVFVYRLN